MQTNYTYPLEILVVESASDHALLITQALDGVKPNLKPRVISNSLDAMAFLRREGCHANAPRPHLVFLDSSLEKSSGHNVLTQIKSDRELKSIPVIVVGDSDDSDEISRAYKLHANCYITKPRDSFRFLSKIRTILDFWLCMVKFPTSDKVFQ